MPDGKAQQRRLIESIEGIDDAALHQVFISNITREYDKKIKEFNELFGRIRREEGDEFDAFFKSSSFDPVFKSGRG